MEVHLQDISKVYSATTCAPGVGGASANSTNPNISKLAYLISLFTLPVSQLHPPDESQVYIVLMIDLMSE